MNHHGRIHHFLWQLYKDHCCWNSVCDSLFLFPVIRKDIQRTQHNLLYSMRASQPTDRVMFLRLCAPNRNPNPRLTIDLQNDVVFLFYCFHCETVGLYILYLLASGPQQLLSTKESTCICNLSGLSSVKQTNKNNTVNRYL